MNDLIRAACVIICMKPLIVDRLGVSLKVSTGELVVSEVAPNREVVRFQLGSFPFDTLVISRGTGRCQSSRSGYRGVEHLAVSHEHARGLNSPSC